MAARVLRRRGCPGARRAEPRRARSSCAGDAPMPSRPLARRGRRRRRRRRPRSPPHRVPGDQQVGVARRTPSRARIRRQTCEHCGRVRSAANRTDRLEGASRACRRPVTSLPRDDSRRAVGAVGRMPVRLSAIGRTWPAATTPVRRRPSPARTSRVAPHGDTRRRARSAPSRPGSAPSAAAAAACRLRCAAVRRRTPRSAGASGRRGGRGTRRPDSPPSAAVSAPARGTTTAWTCSPNSGCGMPTTATSATSGCCARVASISAG